MLHMTKTISPPSRPSRVSVPIDSDTLAVFERLAKVSGSSTGKAIAEWLSDTVEGAELMASTMERARSAPKLVTAELHAMALGLSENTKELMDKFSKMGKAARTGDAVAMRSSDGSLAAIAKPPKPPSCNTGGKLPTKPRAPSPVNSGFSMPPAKVQAYADTNGIPPSRVKPNGKAVSTPQSKVAK